MESIGWKLLSNFKANGLSGGDGVIMDDIQRVVRTYHSVDPNTGYIQTTGNYPNAFDPVRKEAFLELYKANGLRLRRACREMGMSEATISHHLKIDPVFKEKFDGVEADYIENLEQVSRDNALNNPKAVIERIFQLKCLLPLKYGQENGYSQRGNGQIIINIDGKMLEASRKRDETMDAQVITSTLQAESKSVDSKQD